MTDYIRVRDTSGHEVTIPVGRALPDGVEVLDKPALGPDRLPRPPKYRLPLGKPLPGGRTARRRAATKRSQAPAPNSEPATPAPATDPEPDPNGQPAGSAEGEN